MHNGILTGLIAYNKDWGIVIPSEFGPSCEVLIVSEVFFLSPVPRADESFFRLDGKKMEPECSRHNLHAG